MLAWQSGRWPDPIVYLRADLGSVWLLLGIAGSVVAGLGLAVWGWSRWRAASLVASARAEQADLHRQFVRRLDHEVKNPLTALRAALANLNGQGDSPALASVRGQVDRLARLTADLRKLTDLEMQPLEQEPVDLGQLLTELVLLARERPEASCCRFSLVLPQAPWPLPPITGDRDLLFLAFHNLVDNALKFSAAGDTVEVRAFEDGRFVAAEVADTGPGVCDEELPHLGEELYRGSAAIGIEGSGLGLALVRAIVARHGGAMTIRSRLGQGTVVTLRLPVAR
jgi:two-component system OmpR family sensor kinase